MFEFPVLPKGYEFHHIGYATASIERERSLFEFLGYQIEGEPFSDTLQGVSGCFLSAPAHVSSFWRISRVPIR